MGRDDVLILRSRDVQDILVGREEEILEAVRLAYLAHAAGATSLPHSSFLRFPKQPSDRIIALPAYLGGDSPASGLKWISSFPGNPAKGMDRASAVLMLNSLVNGRTEAILEGSTISAKRTAASAALAAKTLHSAKAPARMGIIGCGLINHEIARFSKFVFPDLEEFVLFDILPGKAESVKEAYEAVCPGSRVTIAESMDSLLESCDLVSFATTAATPHIHELACPSRCTILHVSLRDLSPDVILAADNVVDDEDHVCRASTSVHLAEQQSGNRRFIRCSLSDVLNGNQAARANEKGILIFSPFGLGILDIAVARLVMRVAEKQKLGLCISHFHPESWVSTNDRHLSGVACNE